MCINYQRQKWNVLELSVSLFCFAWIVLLSAKPQDVIFPCPSLSLLNTKHHFHIFIQVHSMMLLQTLLQGRAMFGVSGRSDTRSKIRHVIMTMIRRFTNGMEQKCMLSRLCAIWRVIFPNSSSENFNLTLFILNHLSRVRVISWYLRSSANEESFLDPRHLSRI